MQKETAAPAKPAQHSQMRVVASNPQYINNISFAYDSQLPLGISSIATATTDRLRIYIDVLQFGHGANWMPYPRIQIGTLNDVVKGTRVSFQLVFPGPDKAFFWGPDKAQYVGALSWLRLVIIGQAGDQNVYFMLIHQQENRSFEPLLDEQMEAARKWREKG